jgi:hypothetical protein
MGHARQSRKVTRGRVASADERSFIPVKRSDDVDIQGCFHYQAQVPPDAPVVLHTYACHLVRRC